MHTAALESNVDFDSYVLPSSSSGGLYHNVTTRLVYRFPWLFFARLKARAKPKSASLRTPSLVMSTLAAFMSL